jgi:hypothetical protein
MSSSPDSIFEPVATTVSFSLGKLVVELSDGRDIAVPISWYPRLENASSIELAEWELIGDGRGIHWESLDEDISVAGLISGRPSNESAASLQRWLSARDA